MQRRISNSLCNDERMRSLVLSSHAPLNDPLHATTDSARERSHLKFLRQSNKRIMRCSALPFPSYHLSLFMFVYLERCSHPSIRMLRLQTTKTRLRHGVCPPHGWATTKPTAARRTQAQSQRTRTNVLFRADNRLVGVPADIVKDAFRNPHSLTLNDEPLAVNTITYPQSSG